MAICPIPPLTLLSRPITHSNTENPKIPQRNPVSPALPWVVILFLAIFRGSHPQHFSSLVPSSEPATFRICYSHTSSHPIPLRGVREALERLSERPHEAVLQRFRLLPLSHRRIHGGIIPCSRSLMTSWNPLRESHFAQPARQELRGLAFNSISSDVAVNVHSAFMLFPFGINCRRRRR